MVFAFRTNPAIIELDLDQEILYRLPSISEGPVVIKVTHAEPDLSGVPVHFSAPPRYGGITIHRTGMETAAIKAQDDNGGGGIGGDIGPARDLKVELKHSDHLSVSHGHTVVATTMWSDDLWRLKIKRIQDPISPSTERRRYKVVVTYNSLLPVIERRIPLRFFHNGFEENWNKEQYVFFNVSGSNLILGFRPDLAGLYGLNDKHIELADYLVFGGIFSERIELDVGVGQVAINPQGDTENAVFFSVRVNLHGGEVSVKVPVLPGGFEVELLTIPNCTIFIRFYIVNSPLSVRYIPVADFSDLFTKLRSAALNASDAVKTKIVIDKALDRINEEVKKLELLQYESGNPQSKSKFGSFFAPWLMGGDYELLSIGYAPGNDDVFGANGIIQPATGELIVKYVGPRVPEPPGIEIPADNIDDGSIDLFLVPFEVNIPITARRPTGFNPIVPRPGSMEWLRKIDHIIVLMQENRSFDDILGYLSRDHVREYLRISELNNDEMVNNKVIGLAPEGHPDRSEQFNEFATVRFFPNKANLAEPPRSSVTGWAGSTDNPAHGIDDVSIQIDGGSMKGFVKDYARRIGLSPHILR
jgi:phospholipase C